MPFRVGFVSFGKVSGLSTGVCWRMARMKGTYRAIRGAPLLFFSGGTALGPVAAALARFTEAAVYVITTFDSGGSSAVLRNAFHMPAVGDIRARLLALADRSLEGSAEAVAALGYRLPALASAGVLREEFAALCAGEHALLQPLSAPLRMFVMEKLGRFRRIMPPDLDLAGASLGNLVLALGYLEHGRRLEPAIRQYNTVFRTQGTVEPITNESAHLCVELENGDLLVGQHRFTGKEVPPVSSPIKRLWLCPSLEDETPVTLRIQPYLADRIRQAGLICYPVGSFFSSVLANLLPLGVKEAIGSAPCPKVFLPNLGSDPELFGLSLEEQVARLLAVVSSPSSTGLDFVLIDEDESRYPGGVPHRWLAERGIGVCKAELVCMPPYLDAERVCAALLRILKRFSSGHATVPANAGADTRAWSQGKTVFFQNDSA